MLGTDPQMLEHQISDVKLDVCLDLRTARITLAMDPSSTLLYPHLRYIQVHYHTTLG